MLCSPDDYFNREYTSLECSLPPVRVKPDQNPRFWGSEHYRIDWGSEEVSGVRQPPEQAHVTEQPLVGFTHVRAWIPVGGTARGVRINDQYE